MNMQVEAWAGEFGNAYTERNEFSPMALINRKKIWKRILDSLAFDPPRSILEVGSNIGLNLHALDALTVAFLSAVEPNEDALKTLVADSIDYKQLRSGTADDIPMPNAYACYRRVSR